MIRLRLVVFAALAAASAVAPGPALRAADALPLLHADDFEHGVDRWQTTDPDPTQHSWQVIEINGPAGKPTKAFRTTGKSTYQPKHRSPPNYALLKELVVGDFELTARVQSTNIEAGNHRDMCIFWGYQDPTHYYYVHFGAQADPNSCQVFIVNDAPRTPITVKETKGTPWTDGWHTVRVVRRVADGTIEVFFDDMETPLMTARDKTFAWGQVGLGTFDDNGNWDDFELHGVEVKRPAAGPTK
jgi:hypothetical protein